jgi:hypothetical protein
MLNAAEQDVLCTSFQDGFSCESRGSDADAMQVDDNKAEEDVLSGDEDPDEDDEDGTYSYIPLTFEM